MASKEAKKETDELFGMMECVFRHGLTTDYIIRTYTSCDMELVEKGFKAVLEATRERLEEGFDNAIEHEKKEKK